MNQGSKVGTNQIPSSSPFPPTPPSFILTLITPHHLPGAYSPMVHSCILLLFYYLATSVLLRMACKMTACGTALHCYGDNKRMSDRHLTTDFSPAEALLAAQFSKFAFYLWLHGATRDPFPREDIVPSFLEAAITSLVVVNIVFMLANSLTINWQL